ncbi:MAG: hypothetical protein HZC10_02610 [Nitrospirae bacterium]|nr:hypothetical protein [Nitrospirota bacterium]
MEGHQKEERFRFAGKALVTLIITFAATFIMYKLGKGYQEYLFPVVFFIWMMFLLIVAGGGRRFKPMIKAAHVVVKKPSPLSFLYEGERYMSETHPMKNWSWKKRAAYSQVWDYFGDEVMEFKGKSILMEWEEKAKEDGKKRDVK